MERPEDQKTPGLRWQRGKPMWRASKGAVAAGYPLKSANLSEFAGNSSMLEQRCQRLQLEMRAWLSGRRHPATLYDGSIRSLIDCYQTHAESPYRTLKPSTRKPYDVYLEMMRLEVGTMQIDHCDGPAVRRWFRAWSEPNKPGGRVQIPKAKMAIAVLKSVMRFGIECRSSGCAEFSAVLRAIEFPALKPRTQAPSAAMVIAARAAAHRMGNAPAALAYAIQFEGAVRQWDVIGEWIPLEERQPSAVLGYGRKWIGPTWANIDQNHVFRYRPTKTEGTTGKEVAIDLAACPMVKEELEKVPLERRMGPLIVNPVSGLPYTQWRFRDLWRDVARAAGIPNDVWNRDLRAGGITEGRASGATTDDMRKIAGHAEGSQITAEVYDRATLDAHRRVAAKRLEHRKK